MVLLCSWYVIDAYELLKTAEKIQTITYRLNTQPLPHKEWAPQSFSGQKQ